MFPLSTHPPPPNPLFLPCAAYSLQIDLLTSVQMPGKDAANASPSTSQRHDIATKIRSSISLYYPDNLKARLHDLCFEVTSQRLWEAYLGRRHVIFTSWAHLSLYGVDFGGSRGRPRFVEPYMPVLDGLLCLMDGRPGQKDKEGNRNWCDDGVDVAVSDTEMSCATHLEHWCPE
jgi:hypothetical protein